MRVGLAVGLVGWIAQGCGDSDPASVSRRLVLEVPAMQNRELDLLLVIDDSNMMFEKQQFFARSVSKLIDQLSNNPDGLPDIHIGVASTDMGTKASGSPIPAPDLGDVNTGGCSKDGKAGRLQLGQATSVSGTFLSDIKASDGARQRNFDGDLATVVGQMVKLGGFGCGFEQSLAAMRVALDNNPANSGFLRTDALLAVVFFTDEDDCAALDPALFIPDPFLGADSFRCTQFGVTCARGGTTPDGMAQPGSKEDCSPSTTSTLIDHVDAFRDFLLGLKDDTRKIVVAAVVTPPDGVDVRESPNGPRLNPSCMFSEVATAVQLGTPAVRIHALLDMFPDHSASGTICRADLSDPLDAIGARISAAAGTPCIGRPIVGSDPTKPADCVVSDVLGSRVTSIEPCDAGQTATCWQLVSDPACPLLEHQRLEIVRSAVVDPATVTELRCVFP